jgi:radical SAM superfamily enzyme YgiQ (UPF0313 family)
MRSLGPYRIASALENEGFDARVIDFTQYLSIDEIISAMSKVLEQDTLWVGFSSTFFWGWSEDKKQRLYPHIQYDDVLKLFDYIRSHSKAKLVYAGVRAINENDDEIDCYIQGYADTSTIAYTKYLKYNDISLLGKHHTSSNGKSMVIVSNDYEEPKMDNIRTHWWREDFNVLPDESLPLEMARGCIFKCKFCGYGLLGKKKGTYLRDVEEVRDDLIRTWETTGCTNYYIVDDTFNDDNDKVESIHKLFTSLPFKIKFSAYLRIDLINKFPHQADLLKEMGLIGNFFGIESLHYESARAIGKGLHPNKVKDRLHWLREKWGDDVKMGAGFILGLPYDTHEYFNELEQWILQKDNPLSFIEIYPLRLLGKTMTKRNPNASQFNLNPEIYGYEVDDQNFWTLKSQGLDYKQCQILAEEMYKKRHPLNKPADFAIQQYLSMGLSLDQVNDTFDNLSAKYMFDNVNNFKLNQYKEMIGAI